MTRVMLLVALALVEGWETTPAHGQHINIVNKESGLALSVLPDWRLNFPLHVKLSQRPLIAGDVLQRWELQHVGNQIYRIVNPATTLVWQVPKGDLRTDVMLVTRNDSDRTQLWRLAPPRNSNFWEFVPFLHSNRRLDVPGGTRLVSVIQIYKPNGSDAQRWNLIPAR